MWTFSEEVTHWVEKVVTYMIHYLYHGLKKNVIATLSSKVEFCDIYYAYVWNNSLCYQMTTFLRRRFSASRKRESGTIHTSLLFSSSTLCSRSSLRRSFELSSLLDDPDWLETGDYKKKNEIEKYSKGQSRTEFY